jgi:VWFA-related protein
MRISLLVSLTVLVVVAAAGVFAQQQPPVQPAQVGAAQQSPAAAKPQGAPPIVVRTPVVIVPVTVKDAHGQLVGDLNQDDFHILADNVEQKIGSFSAEAVPLSAVVLLDNDLDQRVSSRVQKSLVAISASFGPNDEVAFVAYDAQPQTVTDFSNNNDALFTTLTRFEIGSHDLTVSANPAYPPPGPPPPWVPPLGGSSRTYVAPAFKTTVALNDAIFAASQMLRGRGRDRRKIIFLISDEANSDNNTHGFDETLRSLLISDVSLYSVSVSMRAPVGKKFIQKGALMVEKYAADTGGDTFRGGSQIDLERLYSEVTEQARNEYTLTFSPEAVTKGQDFHPIEVRVKHPDLNVESREGYYESAITPGR